MYVFFVKQKRAYEMRISDRSSDVCSSDLRVLHRLLSARFQAFQFFLGGLLDFLDAPGNVSLCRDIHLAHVQYSFLAEVLRDDLGGDLDRISRNALQFRALFTDTHRTILTLELLCPKRRSEEHTSELQSLMRISYDVFCLKKKTNKKNI